MNRYTKWLSIIVIFILLCINFSFTQESSDENKDKKRIKKEIENIVNDVFKQVERELGVNIYDDNDELGEEEEIEEYEGEECEETKISIKKCCSGEMHNMEKLSLYSFPLDKGIPRNYSAKALLENIDDKFLFRYNRVEGLFFGFRSPHKFHWERDRKLSIFGSIGYSFGTHRWQLDGGLAQQFGSNNLLLEVGVEGHSFVDTRDHWLVGNLENTLNALFVKYDYQDYFLREGFSSWIGFYTRKPIVDLQIKAAYAYDDYSSLKNNVSWSLFRTKQTFRENPMINDGEVRSAILTFDLHKLDYQRIHLAGWSLSFSSEFAGKAFKGDYDFNRYVFDVRRYQPISKYDNINVRLRAATSEGELPAQRMYELGGISTLPAYSYKQFPGNRLLLANLEYIVNGKMLAEDAGFPLSILKSINLILFYDAGFVNDVDENTSFDKGFEKFKFNNIKSDWGFGIGSRDGKFRLGFTWRTDIKEPVSVFVRMSRPF